MFVAIYSAVCAYNILVAMGGEVNESNIDDFQSAAACIAIIITSKQPSLTLPHGRQIIHKAEFGMVVS